MVRHHNQIDPFVMEQMTAPQSGMLGYYFPWDSSISSYSTSSYNPLYSDNRISIQEIDGLIAEMKTCKYYSPKSCSPLLCLAMLVFIFVPMFGGMSPIFVRTHSAGTLIGMIFGGIFGGLALGLALLCCAIKDIRLKAEIRKKMLTEIILRANQTVFAGKDVIIRLSERGSYLAFEFNWKLRTGAPPQNFSNNPFENYAQPPPQPVFHQAPQNGGYTNMTHAKNPW